jgi:tetratricopeptide (TPR) repeat protein
MIPMPTNRRILFFISAAIVTATLVAYEPIRHNGFIDYDDNTYITENPNVKGGITRDSVIWAFTKSYASNWHPLTWLSHMLDCEIYGLNPPGHHVTNVLIHTVSSVLLFWALRKMTGAVWPSAFVAAVFALHPLHVESVAWAAERKDVLSGLFWMLTMLAYAHYAERPNFKRYVLIVLAFVMGLMSKPMVVTLPFVLLLLDWWPLDRLARKATLRHLIAEKIPLFVLSAISCVITVIAQQQGKAVATLEKIPLADRVANMFASYTGYIGKTLWPNRLSVFYPHPHAGFSDAAVIACTLLLVLITATSIYTGLRRKYIAIGWLWYVGTLVPMIGLVQTGAQAMADRYMYIPMLGLLIIIAWAVKDLVANQPHWRIVVASLAVAALLSSLVLTRIQVRYWENNLTLYGHALKVTKNNAVMENNYGCALSDANQLNEAVLHLNSALRIVPTYATARHNLGKVLAKQGKLDEAIACFNEFLRQNGDSAEIRYRLAVLWGMQGKYDEAIKHLGRTVELAPDNFSALSDLAWLLATADEVTAEDADKAVKFARRACELTGHNAHRALDTLAAAYAATGKFDDAVTTAEQAVNIAKNSGQKDIAGEIQKRIELYKTGQRYRQK